MFRESLDSYYSKSTSMEIQKGFWRISCVLLLGTAALTNTPLMQRLEAQQLNDPPLKQLSKKSFVAEAVARSGAAVVTIETQRTVITPNNEILPPGLLIDPYFQYFFGLQGRHSARPRIERGQGSGVIFSAEGLVLTNAHVVESTDQLIIGMSDGRRIPGKVVGRDTLTDLAVIELEGPGPWPTAPLGNSDNVIVGEWAIAVGNPFGLENTVTLGIISNLNRNVAQLGISGKRLDLIQTDAAINPGNSGGPLLNANGEVIGINTLVRSGPGAGLGFAIPINRAREIAKQLVEQGKVSHPMIGVSLSPVLNNQKSKNNIPSRGALIRHVINGGPGDKGGLQVGDVITSVGGLTIKEPTNVISAINNHGVNSPLAFEILRKGKVLIFYITPLDITSIKNL